jgi:hypothetical protein
LFTRINAYPPEEYSWAINDMVSAGEITNVTVDFLYYDTQDGIAVSLEYFIERYPRNGFNNVAIILTADPFGLGLFNQFTTDKPESITVLASVALLADTNDAQVEFTTVKQSRAHVILYL